VRRRRRGDEAKERDNNGSLVTGHVEWEGTKPL